MFFQFDTWLQRFGYSRTLPCLAAVKEFPYPHLNNFYVKPDSTFSETDR